jgi:diadenosine tetraphosphatase ApaH/serine/threonine PP2A family protein phosphatase
LRYAIISDVHGNWEALQAVWHKVEEEEVNRIIFLGDMVGYGPDPNLVIDDLARKADITLAGNHDWGALGKTNITYFNPYAKIAILWTRKVLTGTSQNILAKLPLMVKDEYEALLFVHATPKQPTKWHYIYSLEDASENFSVFTERICFIGHSHYPLFIEKDKSGRVAVKPGEVLPLIDGHQYIINVGSVGQPRDGDPRACYTLYDSETNIVELKRVEYHIVQTQEKMQALGLPSFLIQRLAIGR